MPGNPQRQQCVAHGLESLTDRLGRGMRKSRVEGVGDTVPGITVVYLNPVSYGALCVYPACYSLHGKFQQERC